MEELRVCVKCFQSLPHSDYYKSRREQGGFRSHCKYCDKKYYRKNFFVKNHDTLEGYVKATKQDYYETFSFLKSIGYNLEEDIHKQFCEKYNLTPRKRSSRNKNIYNPKDFNFS